MNSPRNLFDVRVASVVGTLFVRKSLKKSPPIGVENGVAEGHSHLPGGDRSSYQHGRRDTNRDAI